MTQKYYDNEYIPDITKDYLLYSFEIDTGTEINVFDYISKTLKKKIEVSQKGIGIFSSNGNRVIFSSFADTTTWKKDIIVYDRDTGNQIGTTTLDEKAEIKDVSSDDKQIIYTEDGVEKRAKLQHSQ